MKAEEWFLLIMFILGCIIGCGGYSTDGLDRGDDGYEDLNRSINGVAL